MAVDFQNIAHLLERIMRKIMPQINDKNLSK